MTERNAQNDRERLRMTERFRMTGMDVLKGTLIVTIDDAGFLSP